MKKEEGNWLSNAMVEYFMLKRKYKFQKYRSRKVLLSEKDLIMLSEILIQKYNLTNSKDIVRSN